MDRLEQAVRQMKEFTASISHELRTPLTVLRGEAEVVLSKPGTASDYRRVLESQLEEFEKLSQMINRMLTLARAEAGQITLARDSVCLADLAAAAAEQMEPLAASKGLSLTTACEGKVAVTGDPGWLERAVLNLLDNAVKFTPPGGRIEIAVRSENDTAVLEVRDNGMGISAEALPHIFERFYREDSSRSRAIEGAGLGLSLVEWIVRQHQGRVSVTSRPKQGSTFRVELPLADGPAAQPD
jgi:heavy metal sensor kinase